ncbi:hypothetical protein ACQ4PT_043265 [Festuca glaucescens]
MAPLLERQPAAGSTGTESAHTGDAQLTPPPTPGVQEGNAAKAAPARSRRRPGGDDAAGSAREGAFVCRTCSRRFPSFQALGGHRTGHTRLQARRDLPRQQKPARAAHECAVCGLEFAMGQALGGHMRRHKQQVEAPACAEVEVEVGLQKEDVVDSNSTPPLEDRRGGDIREGCSSGMGQALGGHMRRHQQQTVAASVDVDDEERRNEEEALNSSCRPLLEDREGCTSGSSSGPEPRLLNLLV